MAEETTEVLTEEAPTEEVKEEITEQKPEETTEESQEESQGETQEETSEESSEENSEENSEESSEESSEEPQTSKFIDIAKQHFPDDEFESDEDATQAITKKLSEYDDFKKRTQEKDQKIVDIFNSSPEFADIMYLMGQGASYEEAHDFVIGESDIDLDKAKDGWQKAAKDRTKAKKEQEKSIKQTQDNLKTTITTIEKFTKDKKMDETKSTEMLNKVDEIMVNMSKGLMTPEILEVFYKGLNYDETVKQVKENAEVMGRNQAISELKTKKQTGKGDGLPHPESTDPKVESAKQEDTAESRLIRNMIEYGDSRPF